MPAVDITTDSRSPGRKRAQRYAPYPVGANPTKADHLPREVGFIELENVSVMRRPGYITKRYGSATGSYGGGTPTAIPNGLGQLVKPAASTDMVPTLRYLLANFGGTTFKSSQDGFVWSAESKASYADFNLGGANIVTTASQLGANLYLAWGNIGKWAGVGTNIDRVGIIPGASAITFTTTGAVGITWAVGATYVYTLYNSTTGVESDWSPLSAAITPGTYTQINLTIPAMTAENWNKIRIYRTLDGGVIPYLVTEVASGTTAVTDTKTDALLTTKIPDRFDHSRPPQSFISAAYGQSIFYVDLANPHKLVFSKPYTGTDADLEYFPPSNYLICNKPITALLTIPGRLLIFHTDSIEYLSGSSINDYVLAPFCNGVGTIFKLGAAANGDSVVFISDQGVSLIGVGGGTPRTISNEIDEPLRVNFFKERTTGSGGIFGSVTWCPNIREFLFTFGSKDASTSGSLFYSWCPAFSSEGVNCWTKHTWSAISSTKYATMVLCPSVDAYRGNPRNGYVLIPFFDGTNGKILFAFNEGLATDDGSTFTSKILTDKIIPGDNNGAFKLFQGISFPDAYVDPSWDGVGVIKYLLGFDDPAGLKDATNASRDYTSSLITISDTSDVKTFTQTRGRFIHLYISDASTATVGKILLGEFFVHFRERMRDDSR